MDAQDDIWLEFDDMQQIFQKSRDLLIVGALEAAFKEMVIVFITFFYLF